MTRPKTCTIIHLTENVSEYEVFAVNLAVCDNEISHISQISDLLSSYRKEKIADLHWTPFQSGFALLAALDRGETFDAVLLDIYMDDMNGMEVAKRIRAMNSGMHIVFITSSAFHAVESYSVEAVDYLLKPVTEEKLHRALDRLATRMEDNAEYGFTVKDTEGRVTKVIWNQLMYLEAMGHYVLLHHANGSSTKTLMPFSSLLEPLLSHGEFVQSHRSYVVNLRYVHRIGTHELVMLNGAQIPLPKSRHQQLSDRFRDFIFGGEAL